MFSEETLVTMANGSTKNINLIRVNDFILNKLEKVTKVTRKHTYTHNVIGIQLNNDTGVFYCDAMALFMKHKVTDDNHIFEFDTIENIQTEGSKLKNSNKFFSTSSDVSITTFDNTGLQKTLYCIHTSEGTQTFIVNGVITKCNNQ